MGVSMLYVVFCTVSEIGMGEYGLTCVCAGGRVKLANDVTYKRYVYCEEWP